MQMSYSIIDEFSADRQQQISSPLFLNESESERKIRNLVNILKNVNIFMPQEKSNLENWISRFSIQIFNEGSFRGEALQELSYLVVEVVRPTFYSNINEKDFNDLLVLEEQIRLIMETYLPKGQECKVFLDHYQTKLENKKNILEKQIPKPLISERVSSLVKTMHSSNLFSVEEKLQFDQLKNEIKSEQFNSQNILSKQLSSIALGFLLVDHVQPAFERAHNETSRSLLMYIENELENLIHLRLPENTKIDSFIADCKLLQEHFCPTK